MSFYKLYNEEGIQIHQFYSNETGIGIGVFSDIIEKLEVDGGIRLAEASATPIDGTIQYKDGYFQGYGPLGWVRLDAGIEYFTDGEGLDILTGNILVIELADDTIFKSSTGLRVDTDNIKLTDLASPDTNLSLANYRIINLQNPIDDKDAVTKEYVDNRITRSSNQDPARLATVANVDLLATPNELDGVFVQVGDRILVKNQTDARSNGIYDVTVVGSGTDGTWTRSANYDGTSGNEVYGGDSVFITTGTINAGSGWLVIGDGQRIPDVNNINWQKFTAGQSVLADDQDLNVTSDSTGAPYNTGLTLPNDVAFSSHILITVNGKVEDISYDDMTGSFYFSNNGGLSALTKSNLSPGAILWFNPLNANYELETADKIAFVYTS